MCGQDMRLRSSCAGLALLGLKNVHPECREPRSNPLPTRLVDVGSEDKDPRLVETLGETDQHTTLSHCWGKAQPVTATSDEHLQCIPLTLLPQTFREAIHLTRKFQIQYFSIDSLCIIQDSRNNWEVESAMRESFHENLYLVVPGFC